MASFFGIITETMSQSKLTKKLLKALMVSEMTMLVPQMTRTLSEALIRDDIGLIMELISLSQIMESVGIGAFAAITVSVAASDIKLKELSCGLRLK